MNVFFQGMRRSGTTIIFDIFWQDGSFDCYYEPLAKAKEGVLGGGSAVTDIDYFENVRNIRKEFIKGREDIGDPVLLNYGAPTTAELEFVTDPPLYVKDYIRFMANQKTDTMMKFTRIYCKSHVLHEIDPTAKYVLLVRHPISMTESYVFGKNKKRKKHYPTEVEFFGNVTERSSWSNLAFTNYLVENFEEFKHLKGCPDFMRTLLVWKFTFREAYHSARKLFGDNFMLLKHEDLVSSPEETLETLYSHLERPLPAHVLDWTVKHVHAPKPLYHPEHPAWADAFKSLRLEEELELAGYPDCLAIIRDAG
ncbi:MAG: sulfotransferase domain-containing protein [Thermodesulfovibrionales bacterium]|nr:sulfotransferase domain-containing protein [Thermodesulfovibrionales bacterium]